MEIKPLSQIPREVVEKLLSAVPFYNMVKQQDSSQFDVLLEHSHIINYQPGEVVLARGDTDTWLYFLLKGQLVVHAGDQVCDASAVNYITPGEVFGDLAMLVDRVRTATVVADTNSKQITVFSTDFNIFGGLSDTEIISLQTKLAYYRNTVHNLRWKLEVYRMKYPDHAMAENHRQVRLYMGPKDTMEELEGLFRQAQALVKLLLEWNEQFGDVTLSGNSPINPNLVAAIR